MCLFSTVAQFYIHTYTITSPGEKFCMHLFYKQSNGGILGFSHLHVLKLCIILQNLFTYYTSTWSLALPSAKGGKPVVVLRLCRRQRGTKRIIIITILLLSVIMSSPAFAFIVINGIRWCFRRGMKSSRRYEIGFSPGVIRPKHIIYKRSQQRLQLHIIISLPR